MVHYLPRFSNIRTNQLFALRKKLSNFTLIFVMLSSLITINLSNTAYADGTTWTLRNVAANNWKSVTFGEGLFVAVSDSGASHRVMTSPNGNTWTLRELPPSAASQSWRSVTYGVVNGTGIFVAVSESGTGNRVMTSPDGITWTSRTSAADNNWQSVAFGNNVFVAGANSGTGNRVMTSTNGTTWATKPSASHGDWRSVTYGNNTWVAVGRNDPVVMTSSDNGETWASRTAPLFTLMGVTYGNNKFVAVSDQSRVITSSDGITWAQSATVPAGAYQSVTYGNNLFVAVSDSQTARVATSSDGNTWTSRNFGADHNWKGVTWANGVYVAVADHGANRVMTSGTFLLVPAFTLSSSTETRTVNTAATGFTINSTGDPIASFAINTTPPGMSFNTTTGALTGTPNTVAAATNYTITATNASGSATATFTLTVRPVAPAFTLSSASESKTVNTAISGYTISSTGGAIASYAISPAAPAGLTFNTTTGLLSGTPTEVAAATAYTITATNATSSTTQTFTLTVTAVPVVANNADNSAAQAAQAEAARRANEQRQMGDLSSVLPLINELIKEIEEGLKSTSVPKKKSSTSKTQQSSKAKPEKKSNSEPLTIPKPPAAEPEAQKQVGELVSVSHKVGFGLSASWINSSNIKALRGFIAGIEESFEVERIVIQGYAQPTKIGLSDIDIARAKAVKKLLIKDGLDYPIVVEGMGQAESKKGDLSRLAVVIVEGKIKNQN